MKLLVDANKFLAFYQTERLAVILEQLRKIRSSVFVSSQVVYEVDRNKFNCFTRSTQNSTSPQKWSLPSSLLTTGKEDSELLKSFNELQNSSEAMKRKVKSRIVELQGMVARSEDHISAELDLFFGTGAIPTDDQLTRARLRKEIGNPPGKRTDPLGDQLTWEQFLDESRGETDVWILSKDNDYFVTVDGELHLDPLLRKDLLQVCDQPSIKCFNSWSRVLPELKKHSGSSGIVLPSEDELRDLEAVERSLPTTTSTSTTTTGLPSSLGEYCPTQFLPSPPQTCPNCCNQNCFPPGTFLPSSHGLAFTFICVHCHYRMETGEYFD